jgi:hypothetical protein
MIRPPSNQRRTNRNAGHTARYGICRVVDAPARRRLIIALAGEGENALTYSVVPKVANWLIAGQFWALPLSDERLDARE